MYVNPGIYMAVTAGAGMFLLGLYLGRRVTGLPGRGGLAAALALVCLPALAFVGYYLHLFGEPLWYIEARSMPGIELLSALSGLFFGAVYGWMPVRHALWRQLRQLTILPCAIMVLGPFLKPLVLPVALTARLSDQWRDGVCLQSSPSTCGPASLATILVHYGQRHTERAVARGAYSCASGTELWYLMRYARRHGLQARLLHEPRLDRIPTPAILGVRTGGYGHFIILLSSSNGAYVIGEPLQGRLTFTEEEFRARYAFHGCVLHITDEQRE